jgi:hypothetical protein
MPVICGAAELAAGSPAFRRMRSGPGFELNGRVNLAFFGSGVFILALVLAWPHHFFVLIWLGLFLIIEAANVRMGRSALLLPAFQGNWKPLLSVGLGGLAAGVFSEVWNYYAYPKWYYDVPFGNFWHVFELPLLGYLAFLPVGWELYALYQLVAGLSARTPLNRLFQSDYLNPAPDTK